MTQDHKIIQEAMLKHLAEAFAHVPFNQLIGLTVEHLDQKQVIMRFAMKEELIGNFLHGILHGGVISSVLDVVGGLLVMAAEVYKHPHVAVDELTEIVGKCSTVDLQISFLRPGKGEYFIAKAWLLRHGSKISFTRMELINHEESLIATASGTYIIK